MRYAISTKFHGASNFRGSRITATCRITSKPTRVTVPYDHAKTSDDNHKAAAVALCEKRVWNPDSLRETHTMASSLVWVIELANVRSDNDIVGRPE